MESRALTTQAAIKELEPYQPMYIEELCQPQNVDVLADIVRGMHLPLH